MILAIALTLASTPALSYIMWGVNYGGYWLKWQFSQAVASAVFGM